MRKWLERLAQRFPSLRPWIERLEEERDWTGAKNFFLSLGLLGIALVLALNGAAAFERGLPRLGAMYHTLALALTAYVAVKLVPAMARGTPLKWLFYQVDYKLTKEGGVYLTATFIIILAALNTGNNLLFLILASLMAGILISGVVSRMVLTGIKLKLELPEHVFARQPVLASLTLENLKQTVPSFSLTVSSEGSSNGKQRRPKGSKRAQAETRNRRILRDPVYFPYIPRSKDSTQRVDLVFPRRGRYTQGAFSLSSKFPFGFLLKTRSLEAASEAVVYPPVEPTEQFFDILPLISGEMESYYRGGGHDLYSIRAFQPSDTARSIDWKASAKSQELMVREFTREEERRVEVVLDSFLPPAAPPEKWGPRFERAVTFCACLVWHFHELHAQLRFRSPDYASPAAPGGDIIYDILYHLALIQPRHEADGDFLEQLQQDERVFKIILTARPRAAIPAGLFPSSYFIFQDTLE